MRILNPPKNTFVIFSQGAIFSMTRKTAEEVIEALTGKVLGVNRKARFFFQTTTHYVTISNNGDGAVAIQKTPIWKEWTLVVEWY